MAEFKSSSILGNIAVTGSIVASGDIKTFKLNIPTASGGSTLGPGSNGQVLKSNGTSVYWGTDNNTVTDVSFTRHVTDGTKIGTISINGTSTDIYSGTHNKVNQSVSSYDGWRKIMLSSQYSTDKTFAVETTDDVLYASTALRCHPRTGGIDSAGTINAATLSEGGTTLSNKYLKLSGGIVTGPVGFTTASSSTNSRIVYDTFRNSGLMYDVGGNEALVISSGFSANSSICFYPSNKLNMVDNKHSQWSAVTPTMQMRSDTVGINKLNTSSAFSYNLDVNGTANATTLYENGSALSGKYLSIETATDTYLPKTTYEWNKEVAFGQTGLLYIGAFPMYDSNITVDIDSTTSITYHATLVIATQNIDTAGGGSLTATVYGDATNTITPNIYIAYVSGSNNVRVYFQPQSWSKNLIHIRCVALQGTPTNICSNISSLPSDATRKPTNALTSNYLQLTGGTLSGNVTLNDGVALVSSGFNIVGRVRDDSFVVNTLGNTSQYTKVTGSATVINNVTTLTIKGATPSAGQILTTNANGIVSWTSPKVAQDYSTTNANYPLLLSATSGTSSTSSRGTGTTILNNNIYANPSTGRLYSKYLTCNENVNCRYLRATYIDGGGPFGPAFNYFDTDYQADSIYYTYEDENTGESGDYTLYFPKKSGTIATTSDCMLIQKVTTGTSGGAHFISVTSPGLYLVVYRLNGTDVYNSVIAINTLGVHAYGTPAPYNGNPTNVSLAYYSAHNKEIEIFLPSGSSGDPTILRAYKLMSF